MTFQRSFVAQNYGVPCKKYSLTRNIPSDRTTFVDIERLSSSEEDDFQCVFLAEFHFIELAFVTRWSHRAIWF